MQDTIVTIYCLCDDFLKALDHHDDPQAKLTTAQVMTVPLVAARFFGGNLNIIALHDEQNVIPTNEIELSKARYTPCGSSRPLLALKSITSALRSRPSMILVGHANFSVLGWILARLFRIPMVVFLYGTDVWEPLKSLRRRSLQKADIYLAISRFTAQRAIESNQICSDKIRILHNCLDPKLDVQPLKHLDSNAEQIKPSLLTVSRITLFEPYKGHEYVIKAMPQLLKSFPNLVYDIVGDGDRRPILEVLAEQEKVSHAVRFHGVVSDEALTRLYANAWVFVMPSHVEGFGFVFLEAMAQGTPAIGGNTDAAGEVIVDGQTGFLVSPTEPDEIAKAVTHIVGNDALRAQMRHDCIFRAQNKFHFDQFKRDLMHYLSELTAQKP